MFTRSSRAYEEKMVGWGDHVAAEQGCVGFNPETWRSRNRPHKKNGAGGVRTPAPIKSNDANTIYIGQFKWRFYWFRK
jgi:hypothetical protein